MLTLQQLKDMPPNTVFARGEVEDSPDGVNMSNSGGILRWVAVRGGIWDWAIYCHYADRSWEFVKSQGDKIYGKTNIKKLVPCDDEAFKKYRY